MGKTYVKPSIKKPTIPKNPFVCPKNPGLFPTFTILLDPYIPVLGMGLEPKTSYSIGRGRGLAVTQIQAKHR